MTGTHIYDPYLTSLNPYTWRGQVETEETESWNGKLKRKSETEKLKSGNGRQNGSRTGNEVN